MAGKATAGRELRTARGNPDIFPTRRRPPREPTRDPAGSGADRSEPRARRGPGPGGSARRSRCIPLRGAGPAHPSPAQPSPSQPGPVPVPPPPHQRHRRCRRHLVLPVCSTRLSREVRGARAGNGAGGPREEKSRESSGWCHVTPAAAKMAPPSRRAGREEETRQNKIWCNLGGTGLQRGCCGLSAVGSVLGWQCPVLRDGPKLPVPRTGL